MSRVLPQNRFMTRGPIDGGVALTFDDGPHPEHTPRLLDLLDKQQIRATFFVLGRQAELYPELVLRMIDSGHEIGNHTWSHAEPGQLGTREFAQELDETASLIQEIAGQRPSLFRPPKGKLTLGKTAALLSRRQCIVLWDRDPRDYAAADGDAVVSSLLSAPIEHGNIVLMHDIHPHCITALPTYAKAVRDTGLDFATPHQWLTGHASAFIQFRGRGKDAGTKHVSETHQPSSAVKT